MSLLGIHLTLLAGKGIPTPVPSEISEALDTVQVSHSDQGRSGFQINFRIGRSGMTDRIDYRLVLLPLLQPFNRIVLLVTLNALPRVLMDGVITNSQMRPGDTPGTSTLSITGEDLSALMDLEEVSVEHPAQAEVVIANKIVGKYAAHGVIPEIIAPPSIDVPLAIERTPVQRGTDLSYLQQMADRFGYVFYVKPGRLPLTSHAYWGPPIREGLPQPALSVNLGSETNVQSIDFQYDALRPVRVSGRIKDRTSDKKLPVETFVSTRIPLSSQPALPFNIPNVKTKLLSDANGLSYPQAWSRAQGTTNKSTDEVVTASGQLDALEYGELLEPRGLVGVRGVGMQHDGHYYVSSVTHNISEGEYTQQFSLSRDGQGSLSPVVRV